MLLALSWLKGAWWTRAASARSRYCRTTRSTRPRWKAKRWRAPWYLPAGALPDNETFTVTVRATDAAGRVTRITPTLRADIVPPSAPTLTLQHEGTTLAPGAVVRELSPTLDLAWTESQDGSTALTTGGSGAVDYAVEWLVTVDGAQTVVTGTPDLDRTATYTAPEAAELTARLGVQDVHGQQVWQRVGPVTVDAPRTPDYVTLRAPTACRAAGWRAAARCWASTAACSVTRSTRHVERRPAPLRHLGRQWPGCGLAWTGANWSGDGDLFLYLDTGLGGTTTAFDPYGTLTRRSTCPASRRRAP